MCARKRVVFDLAKSFSVTYKVYVYNRRRANYPGLVSPRRVHDTPGEEVQALFRFGSGISSENFESFKLDAAIRSGCRIGLKRILSVLQRVFCPPI